MKPLDTVRPIDISSIQPVERSSSPTAEPKTVEAEETGASGKMDWTTEKASEKAPEKTDKAERDRENQKEMVQKMMHFYHKELTAKERAELDPLLHEWMYQITELTRGRR